MTIANSRILHVLQIPVVPMISPCYRPIRQLRALKRMGAEVGLACLRITDREAEKTLGSGLIQGISLFPVLPNFPQGIFRELGILLFSWRKIARVLNTFKPDLVHVHNPPDTTAFVTALVCRQRKIPLVYDIHDSSKEVIGASDFAPLLKGIFQRVGLFFEGEIIKRSAGIVTVSESLKQRMLETRGVFHIHAPYFEVMRSVDESTGELTERVPVEEKDYLYYSGVLYARFIGLEFLISSAGELLRKGRTRLLIAGDGPYRKILEDTVKAGQLSDAVHFLGHLPKEKNLEMIQAACLTVIPYESNPLTAVALPNKLFEYMALGKAIVFPDLPGFREVLGSDNPGAYRPDDPEDLVRVLDRLLADAGLRKRTADTNRRLAKEITFEKEFAKLAGMYVRILNAGSEASLP